MRGGPWELPDGWEWTTLGAMCHVNPRGLDDRPAETSLVSFVPMAAVDEEGGEITGSEVRPLHQVWKGHTPFREGDVLFAKITPCMENGKAAIARGLANGIGFGTTEFHILRPLGGIPPEFVFYYIRRKSFRNEAARNMTGTVGQLRVPKEFLLEAPIPIPPAPEQRRIVATIQALQAGINIARRELEILPSLTRKIVQTVLAKAFRGELSERELQDEPASVLMDRVMLRHRTQPSRKGPTARPSERPLEPGPIPEGWERAELHLFCEPGRPITYGILKPGPDQPQGVLYVRVVDIGDSGLNLDRIRRTTPEIAAHYRRSLLRSGDVLLSIRGSIGKVCRVPPQLEGGNITQDTARISVIEDMDPDYVMWCLRGPYLQRWMREVQKGVGVRGINIGDVRVLEIPIPPLAEQHRIVARIESFLSRTSVVQSPSEAAKRRLDEVAQSILSNAFRGRIVEQDPNDVPASVLLERIRHQREKGYAGADRNSE